MPKNNQIVSFLEQPIMPPIIGGRHRPRSTSRDPTSHRSSIRVSPVFTWLVLVSLRVSTHKRIFSWSPWFHQLNPSPICFWVRLETSYLLLKRFVRWTKRKRCLIWWISITVYSLYAVPGLRNERVHLSQSIDVPTQFVLMREYVDPLGELLYAIDEISLIDITIEQTTVQAHCILQRKTLILRSFLPFSVFNSSPEASSTAIIIRIFVLIIIYILISLCVFKFFEIWVKYCL